MLCIKIESNSHPYRRSKTNQLLQATAKMLTIGVNRLAERRASGESVGHSNVHKGGEQEDDGALPCPGLFVISRVGVPKLTVI